MNIQNIIIVSILIEALITYADEIFINKEVHWEQIVSIVIGIFVAVAFQVDLPKLFGLESVIPLVGQVITGIIFSRGSNYVNDLLTKLNTYKTEPNSDQAQKTL